MRVPLDERGDEKTLRRRRRRRIIASDAFKSAKT
jgi:hypothetical protein